MYGILEELSYLQKKERIIRNLSKNELINGQLCTLSAKDRGATKNPVVDLEMILVHHFSRILLSAE